MISFGTYVRHSSEHRTQGVVNTTVLTDLTRLTDVVIRCTNVMQSDSVMIYCNYNAKKPNANYVESEAQNTKMGRHQHNTSCMHKLNITNDCNTIASVLIPYCDIMRMHLLESTCTRLIPSSSIWPNHFVFVSKPLQ